MKKELKNMQINLNNKKIKLAIIIMIIISAFISIMAIYKYYINDWICYQDNVPPKDAMIWNDALDYRIYLKRSGFIYTDGKDNRILSKSEMNELKKLVKELKIATHLENMIIMKMVYLLMEKSTIKIKEMNIRIIK